MYVIHAIHFAVDFLSKRCFYCGGSPQPSLYKAIANHINARDLYKKKTSYPYKFLNKILVKRAKNRKRNKLFLALRMEDFFTIPTLSGIQRDGYKFYDRTTNINRLKQFPYHFYNKLGDGRTFSLWSNFDIRLSGEDVERVTHRLCGN
ncbi:MAG: hypothetical protein ACFIN6_00460 [Candidatus Walczuchella monophlebidarum]